MNTVWPLHRLFSISALEMGCETDFEISYLDAEIAKIGSCKLLHDLCFISSWHALGSDKACATSDKHLQSAVTVTMTVGGDAGFTVHQ